MKLTNKQLRQIIKEELSKVLNENSGYIQTGFNHSQLAEALSINIMHFLISGNAGKPGFNMSHDSMEEVIAQTRRVVAADPTITRESLGQAMQEYAEGRMKSLDSQNRNARFDDDVSHLGKDKANSNQVLKIYSNQIAPQIFN